jgi:type VI secretion system protein ImpL
MGFISRVISAFMRANVVLAFVFVILSAAVWFFGPLIGLGGAHPLESVTSRVVTIAVLFAITLFTMLLIALFRARRNNQMAEEIVDDIEDDVDETDETVRAELAEMRIRMKDALKTLTKSKLGGSGRSQKLYQLPWYIMIGPPGAGKTTAIINSGLQFPLAEKMGMKAVGGIGGTRNCDWWFTNEAVLIDTAGRYTTQDSDADADSRAWGGFLNMLKKFRKRQPINGAIVAISLADISTQNEEARKEYATAIRLRLTELREKLGVRFPVYILLTKADLIVGFSEFFENLGKQEREQVWGFTYPIKSAKTKRKPLDGFDDQFTALLERLNNHSVERLQQVSDPLRRSMIAGFPQQVSSLRPVVKDFLAEIFLDSKFSETQLVRGLYFSSGTQEGTPIDRLMGGMAKTFGLGRQAVGSGHGSGRSYFLRRVLDQVVFSEAGLVSADDKVERRYKWILRSTIAAAVLVTGGILGLWGNSYLKNSELVNEASEGVDKFAGMISQVPGNPIEDTNVRLLVEPLNILHDLPGNPAQDDPEPPRALTYGLYQGDAIGSEAAQTYRTTLNQKLLPRLLVHLEDLMQVNMNNPTLLYEALKVYLMLGQQGPMDRDLVSQWFSLEWAAEFADDPTGETQRDLVKHLQVMINEPMISIPLDGPLVEQVQGILSETPVARRAYRTIVDGTEAKALPEWTLLKAGGPATSRVMSRPSGLQLSKGISGIYTHDGFFNVFLPAALDVAEQIKKENWVLGERAEDFTNPNALSLIARDVLDLYYSDYIIEWETMMGDVDIAPMSSMSQAVNTINVLSGPTSPIVNILNEVAEQTRLAERKGSALVSGVTEGVSSEGSSLVLESFGVRTQRLLSVLQSSAAAEGQEPVKPGQVVQDRFASLHDFVKGFQEGVPGELDNVMQIITSVYQELNRLSVSGGAAQQGEAVLRLQETIVPLDGAIKRWSNQIIDGASGAAAGGKRSKLNNLWQAQVLPFCKQALDNRYPFDRKSRAEVGVQDFSRLFAPQGLIDAFFLANLAEHVDTTSSPWKWKRTKGKDLGISDSVLLQFQLAAEIRDAYFLAPGLPSITFDLKPIALDPNAQQITLLIDGQPLVYAHGPQQTTSLKWPQGGATSVTFAPAIEGRKNLRQMDGPWGWFRLLDSAEVRRTNVADQSRVVFNVGGRIAMFQMRAGSAINPFSSKAVKNFNCPSSL